MIKNNTFISKIHVRKGDLVRVLSGRDKGKEGRVLAVSPKERKIMVSGINIVSKHIKSRNQVDQAGIIKTESAMYSCKVQLVCPSCNKRVRVSHQIIDGKKKRVCKKCYKVI